MDLRDICSLKEFSFKSLHGSKYMAISKTQNYYYEQIRICQGGDYTGTVQGMF